MNRTKIEYLDYTLNVVVGCNGRGCAVKDKCWARAQAKRKKHYCSNCYQFIPHFHVERIKEPLKVKKPSRIGLNFMGDTFDFDLIDCPRTDDLFSMVEKAHWHTFILFTKQPQHISKGYLFPKNLWLGVSVNTRKDLWRIKELQKTNAVLKVVSFEPLYEDLGDLNLKGIGWVIIGGQTRPKLKPKSEWVADIIMHAILVNAAIFTKNNLEYEGRSFQEFPKREGTP